MASPLKPPLPALTVVIPNFNHGHLIGDQLRSIFSQTVQPSKIIIIDDASTDNSVATIRSLISSRQDVELICKSANSGPVGVMNEALRLAETEFVTFLAADDMTLPGFFEKSLGLLSLHPEAAICSGVSLVQYRSRNDAVPHRVFYPSAVAAFLSAARVRELLLRLGDWMIGNTTVYRREPLLAAGGFDPELGSVADGFLSRVLALRHGACFVPEVLAIWRRIDAGYSNSTSRDDSKFTRLLIVANARMATQFKELFPDALVERSNARMLSRILAANLDNFEARVGRMLEGVPPLPGSSMLLLLVRWAKRILKFLLFCALRPYDVPRFALSRLWRK